MLTDIPLEIPLYASIFFLAILLLLLSFSKKSDSFDLSEKQILDLAEKTAKTLSEKQKTEDSISQESYNTLCKKYDCAKNTLIECLDLLHKENLQDPKMIEIISKLENWKHKYHDTSEENNKEKKFQD